MEGQVKTFSQQNTDGVPQEKVLISQTTIANGNQNSNVKKNKKTNKKNP